eukprot:217835_1
MSVLSSSSHNKPKYVDHIDPFKQMSNTDTMSAFIDDILASDSPCITKWNRNENTDQYNKIKKYLIRTTIINDKEITQYRYPHCWILPEYTIDDIEMKYRIAFDFSFKIIIYHKNELYESTFGATYHHIAAIHRKAIESTMFPTHIYPQVHPDVKMYRRTDELDNDMKLEDLYTVLENKLRFDGPGKNLLTRQPKKAQARHLDYYCILLNKIFNCPGFAIQDILYDILNDNDTDSEQRLINTEEKYNNYARIRRKQIEKENIHQDLILLLKHKAFRKLKQWRHDLKCKIRVYQDIIPIMSNGMHKFMNECRFKMYNPLSRKYTKIVNRNKLICLFNDTYHTVFIVSREDTFMIDHWAIIFEGLYYLLRIEYCHEVDDIKKGFVVYQIFKNDNNGQRTCWYCAKKKIKNRKQLFNERWSVLSMTYLKKSVFEKDVNFKFIHDLVENICMQDAKYFMTTNNCQIFVRNIYGVLDVDQAKLLNVKLQHRNMANAVPSGPVVVQISELIAMEKFIEAARERVKYVKCVSSDDYMDILKILGQNVFVDDFECYDENKLENIDENIGANIDEENMNVCGNDIEEEIDIKDVESENGEEQESDHENDEKKEIVENSNLELEDEARKLLLEFEIPEEYIDKIIVNLKKVKFIKIEEWEDIYDDEDFLVNDIGFKRPFARKFKRKYCEWMIEQKRKHIV